MEIRALAIAFFYAIGTAIGGITGPLVFEKLGESATRPGDVGYFVGAAVMAVGGIVELFLGVRAEQQPLENIAKPITARGGRGGGRRRRGPERAEAEERDRRNRARWERERMGLRRYRPGPGRLVLAVPAAADEPNPDWLDHEVAIIDRALQEHGELDARELGRADRGALLGPGPLPRGAARGASRRSRSAESAATATRRRGRGRHRRARAEADAARLRDRRPPGSVLGRGRDDALELRARVRVRGLEGLRKRGRSGPLRNGVRPRGRATTSVAGPLVIVPLRLTRRRCEARLRAALGGCGPTSSCARRTAPRRRVRLPEDRRPLPPLDGRPGPQPVRVVGARPIAARTRAPRAGDRRHLSHRSATTRRSSPRRRRRSRR